jgi:hypothetical protein
LDWIFHSYEYRKAKIEKYERMRAGGGHAFQEYYLYEDVPGCDDYFVPVLESSIPKNVLRLGFENR